MLIISNQPEPQKTITNIKEQGGISRTHGQHRPNYFKDYYLRNKENLKEYSRDCYATTKLLKENQREGEWIEKQGLATAPYVQAHPLYLKKKNHKQKKRSSKNYLTPNYLKVLDNPNIRIKTKNKIPSRPAWTKWHEKLEINILVERYGEAGARTGLKIFYKGKQRFLYVLDEDFYKDSSKLPAEAKAEIDRKSKARNEAWGVSYTNTKHGRHTIILSDQEIPDLVIKHKLESPIDFLSKGRQFIIMSKDKERIKLRKEFLIVKNLLGLKRKLAPWDYNLIEKSRIKAKENNNANIKYSDQVKHKQIIRENTRTHEIGETFIIKEWLSEKIKLEPGGSMREPWRIKTPERVFYLDSYYKNQEIILDYIDQRPTLELKQGEYAQFFNKLIWQ